MTIRRVASVMVTVFALVTVSAAAADTKLAAGTANGSFTVNGKETKLAHAAAFVDQKDDRKPVILVLSDQLMPSSDWKSETDFMMAAMKQKIVGVAFWLDGKGEVFRSHYFDGTPLSTSASGIFDLKLDPAAGKDLAGSAQSTPGAASLSEPVKLSVTFHATR